MDITRRDLLKLLAAGGGATLAAAFVPEKWTRPLVQSGVLPVHAQASGPVVLSNLIVLMSMGQQGAYKLAAPALNVDGTFPCEFDVDFNDVLKQVDDSALLYVSVQKPSGWVQFVNGESLGSLGAWFNPTGDPDSDIKEEGTIAVILQVPDDASIPFTFRVKLKVGNRMSNEIEGELIAD